MFEWDNIWNDIKRRIVVVFNFMYVKLLVNVSLNVG